LFTYMPKRKIRTTSHGVYTLQPVVQSVTQPVAQQVVKCKHLFDNRLHSVQSYKRATIGCTTGWTNVYTMQPLVQRVVQPIVQPAASCMPSFNKQRMKSTTMTMTQIITRIRPGSKPLVRRGRQSCHHTRCPSSRRV